MKKGERPVQQLVRTEAAAKSGADRSCLQNIAEQFKISAGNTSPCKNAFQGAVTLSTPRGFASFTLAVSTKSSSSTMGICITSESRATTVASDLCRLQPGQLRCNQAVVRDRSAGIPLDLYKNNGFYKFHMVELN